MQMNEGLKLILGGKWTKKEQDKQTRCTRKQDKQTRYKRKQDKFNKTNKTNRKENLFLLTTTDNLVKWQKFSNFKNLSKF